MSNPQHSSASAERFWSKVDKSAGDDACWPWTACKQPVYKKGHHLPYGHFKVGGKHGRVVLAHRQAYELARGPIAPGLKVRHACDNASCCNPKHLMLGTQKENVADAMGRGRQNLSGLRRRHARAA